MITIIFAPPRTGKTCFMTHCLNEAMYNRQRNTAMQAEIIQKQSNGFECLSIPQHCVSANYVIKGRKFGYRPRYNRVINPYKLGFKNEYVDVHFNLPYEVIGITEAQKYLNSRMSSFFPDWQSRWYEQHGHNDIDVYLDAQRPKLIDINIRELSSFVEIVKLDISHNKFGKISKLNWLVRNIENSSLLDKYLDSGKQDTTCYTEEIVTANYNVFECYDSQSCKPKFYDGHFNDDFDYLLAKETEHTKQGYIEYLHENDDELPEGFYQMRKRT